VAFLPASAGLHSVSFNFYIFPSFVLYGVFTFFAIFSVLFLRCVAVVVVRVPGCGSDALSSHRPSRTPS
jgi:hypothetical protein